jgi:hypothetical protein
MVVIRLARAGTVKRTSGETLGVSFEKSALSVATTA